MLRERIEQGKIYFRNSEKNVKIEEVLEYLNSKADSEIRFQTTGDMQKAEYAVLIIGEGEAGKLPSIEETRKLLYMQQCIVLVKKVLFDNYEKYRKEQKNGKVSDNPAYQVIRIFNEDLKNRRWIYTYTFENEISIIIGKIILSEYFSINFSKSKVNAKTGECFENILTFKNTGYTRLEGYYIDGLFIHNTGKHRPRLESFDPVIGTVWPHKEIQMKMNFQAPDIAGSFIFYLIIKKRGRILKMDDSIRKFILHVTSAYDTVSYDAVLLEESPPNGILYTDKMDFLKNWKLKNISGENWKKIIFKIRYEHLTHYFCKERRKIIYDVPDGSEFTISGKFYTPDIPGKYTAFGQLLREDGTEITTDGPLCCSVVTQYERQSQFEII